MLSGEIEREQEGNQTVARFLVKKDRCRLIGHRFSAAWGTPVVHTLERRGAEGITSDENEKNIPAGEKNRVARHGNRADYIAFRGGF